MVTKEANDPHFCSGCSQQLDADARFCPTCGREIAAAPTPRRARPAMLGLAVFGVFLLVGVASLYAISQRDAPGPRAVAGSPTPVAAGETETSGALPRDHPPIELPKDILDFLAELETAAKADPKDLEAWRKLARARFRAGMLDRSYYAGATEALDHVLELAPDDLEAIRTKANIAYDQSRFGDAEQLFGRYLALDPADPGVRTDLASSILFQGRDEEARTLYRAVLESNPDFVQAHVNLGIALHADGERDAAMESFRRAKELATAPEQREQIDRIIAAAEGHAPNDAAGGAAPPAAKPPTNANTDFQRAVDGVIVAHPIVGRKLARIEWTGPATGAVHLTDFPMDKMPPVVRNKFKSNMNEAIAGLANDHDVGAGIAIALVDDATGRTMDQFDGKELIGAFDQPQDE
jgi:cytochrome c-type biogenesis protein CcmH/NrfG